jgi:arsenate reductase (glutaredoxin)
MKRVYFLSTCDTCQRLIKQWQLPDEVERIDIKERPLRLKELEQLRALTDSYESLFSKRARLYKDRELAKQNLSDSDVKILLLEHYTFLKRPVLIWDEHIFIGNSKKTTEEVSSFLSTREV